MKKIVEKYLKKYNVVTFDVFDTLIKRNVSVPSDVFFLAGKEILGALEADDFRKKRCEAEHMAREKRLDKEITLAEIYEELKPIYGELCEEIIAKEMAEEIRVCHVKDKYAQLLKECVAAGKKVYLISDMYLPRTVINEILYHCGIKGYEKLYVSNEYRENKESGNLFRIVIKENDIDRRKMIHIGDSIRADFIGAHKAKVKSSLFINAILIAEHVMRKFDMM